MAATPQEIEGLIRAALPVEHVEVVGDGRHFQAVVVSSAFSGKGMIEQHRLVYQALGGRVRDEDVHALSIKTYTPDEWNKNA